MKAYRFNRLPKALRNAKLGNLVLMPASALPFKQQYQELANHLPAGGVLIVASTPTKAVRATAELLRARGHLVALLSATK